MSVQIEKLQGQRIARWLDEHQFIRDAPMMYDANTQVSAPDIGNSRELLVTSEDVLHARTTELRINLAEKK